MSMKKQITIDIVGGGIVGLITAITIKKMLPDVVIDIYDAGADPKNTLDLTGTTFGKGSRDARQFTGSESLSFQNPVHARALRLAPGEHRGWAGWRLISEEVLSENERRWRSDSANRFVDLGHEDINVYDLLHAELNYAGISSWELLENKLDYIKNYKISTGPVSIFFLSKSNFESDLDSETNFLKKFGSLEQDIRVKKAGDFNESFDEFIGNRILYPKALELPGLAYRIRSLGLKVIEDLEHSGVRFHWNKRIISESTLRSDFLIWTAGTTHEMPNIYKKYSLIQGIAGCWVTIPNKGFTKPFKISVEQPSGYINITPDGKVLHISGGFGWIGEKSYDDTWDLMQPIIEHFKKQINKFFRIPIQEMNLGKKFPVSICIRPSSPTGLPDTRVIYIGKSKHIILTGSGKSGSTQAPLLGLYAAFEINSVVVKKYLEKNKDIEKAIKKLKNLHKIHNFTKSATYPSVLEKDLFANA